MNNSKDQRIARNGFTLVELVVVILILGILAAVAAPKLLNTSGNATDNGIKQTLAIIRDAIELYNAENGALPGADGNEATFKADIAPFLRGVFPDCPVGAKNNAVKLVGGTGGMTGVPNPTEAYRYHYVKGEFIVNYNQPTSSDPSVNYDDL